MSSCAPQKPMDLQNVMSTDVQSLRLGQNQVIRGAIIFRHEIPILSDSSQPFQPQGGTVPEARSYALFYILSDDTGEILIGQPRWIYTGSQELPEGIDSERIYIRARRLSLSKWTLEYS